MIDISKFDYYKYKLDCEFVGCDRTLYGKFPIGTPEEEVLNAFSVVLPVDMYGADIIDYCLMANENREYNFDEEAEFWDGITVKLDKLSEKEAEYYDDCVSWLLEE